MVSQVFENQKRLSIYILFIDLLCHTAAFFLYRIQIETLSVPEHWHRQFYALLIFTSVLSLTLLYQKGSPYRALFLGLKFIALLIISYPLNDNLGVVSILITALFLDIIAYCPLPMGIPGSLFCLFLVTLAHGQVLIWDDSTIRMDTSGRIYLIFFGLVIILLSSTIKKLLQEHWERIHQVKRLDGALRELNRVNLDFQSYAITVERESVEQERKRIARELHDIIGYTLTNQLMIIQAVMSLKDWHNPQLDTLLHQAQKQLNEGMEDARTALRQLHGSEDSKDRGMNLIVKLVRTFEKITGVRVILELANIPNTLGDRLDDVLYRFIQEGMTNAFRHGKATEIKIIFWKESESIQVSVWDNGIGGGTIKEGLGIRGMKERFAGLGGDIRAEGHPGGFTLTAWLPVQKKIIPSVKKESDE